MGKSASWALTLFLASGIVLTGSLVGCSSGKAVTTGTFPVPASISISPSPSLSMEVGTNQALTATVESSAKTSITEPVTYQSSNTAVVTVAANGLVCAGSWDSLSAPQVCTPGPAGVSLVTATAMGVSSPPTTVYVHQHIDKVVLNQIFPVNTPPPVNPCLSVGQTAEYEARAYNHGIDITATVGPFSFQSVNTSVAKLSSTASVLSNFVNGVSQNQVQATAAVPGTTPLYATIGTATSLTVNFTTCAVQSISLSVTSESASSETIMPTVIDTLGTTITGVPLTWSSSEPASVGVSGSGVATATTGQGGATIIASCTPPTCNTGFLPSRAIYPENAVTVFAPAGNSTQTATVYVGSTACGTTDGCVSTIVPVTVPANTLGTAISLPATPDSLLFNLQGAKAYLGTDSGLLGTKGLMVLDTSTNSVTAFTSTPGKVLAVSPDGNTVIVSDTGDVPNQVFIFDAVANTNTALSISGATAADFSPDSLKAFIVAGNTLYEYSKLDALKTIALSAPANDVSFLSEGAFVYVAGGAPNEVTVWTTCANGQADTVPLTVAPTFLRTLPGQAQLLPHDTAETYHVLALEPPHVDIISATSTPTGCSPGVSDSAQDGVFDLGHGNFVARQLIVSQDGSTAYILADTLSSILVFNIAAEISSSIPLNGNAMPLQGSLAPNGAFLYVGASDGTLHILQTATASDLQQISFPQSLCLNSAGQSFGNTCNPDLVAVKP